MSKSWHRAYLGQVSAAGKLRLGSVLRAIFLFVIVVTQMEFQLEGYVAEWINYVNRRPSKRMKPFSKIILFLIMTFVFSIELLGQSIIASSSIALRGKSAGGTLTLTKAPALNYPYVFTTNQFGKSAAVAIERLAEEIKACSSCEKVFGANPVSLTDGTMVLQGGTMDGACSTWILGGTETGFNIPHPPRAVSANFSNSRILVTWNNSTEYDSIAVICGGIPLAALSGSANRYVHEQNSILGSYVSSDDLSFMIVGCKAGVPSNGAGVRLQKRALQESLMNIPFACGIAPNCEPWSYKTAGNDIGFEQGNLPGMEPGTDVRQFQGKGFYQIIKGSNAFTGGVSRRFLGLLPGHTYRVGARLNTLGTRATNNWMFSLHAVYNPSNAQLLSAEQMAGAAALPDGSKGPAAGLVARYDANKLTDGNWADHFSTGSESGKPSTDITLPKGSDTITIWFRLTGNNVTNIVAGFDSVTLEDLGI